MDYLRDHHSSLFEMLEVEYLLWISGIWRKPNYWFQTLAVWLQQDYHLQSNLELEVKSNIRTKLQIALVRRIYHRAIVTSPVPWAKWRNVALYSQDLYWISFITGIWPSQVSINHMQQNLRVSGQRATSPPLSVPCPQCTSRDFPFAPPPSQHARTLNHTQLILITGTLFTR